MQKTLFFTSRKIAVAGAQLPGFIQNFHSQAEHAIMEFVVADSAGFMQNWRIEELFKQKCGWGGGGEG